MYMRAGGAWPGGGIDIVFDKEYGVVQMYRLNSIRNAFHHVHI